MKFNLIFLALFTLLCVTTTSVLAGTEGAFYFLSIKGECDCIEKITINDLDILGGKVKAVKYPISINAYLVKGLNTLKLVTTTASNNSLAMIIEKRTSGPKIEQLVRLNCDNLRAKDKSFQSSVQFNLSKLEDSNSINESKVGDEREILSLVKNYFQALQDKDLGAINSYYAKSLKLESKLRPRVSKYFKTLLKQEGLLLSNSDLQITCQPINNVAVMVNGSWAIATAKDNSNLIESNKCEVKGNPVVLGIQNKIQNQSKVSMKLKKSALKFVKTEGLWNLAIPIGVQ